MSASPSAVDPAQPLSQQTMVFGLGPGHCGFRQLKMLLESQPQTSASIQMPPLLPWVDEVQSQSIDVRIGQMLAHRRGSQVVADIAAYYLPYADRICQSSLPVRMICLLDDPQQIIRRFCQQLDQTSRLPIDHWSRDLPAGWYRDLLWSRTFPKYDAVDRSSAILQYCQHYAETAQTLAQRYPDRFAIWQRSDLRDRNAMQQIVQFIGFPDQDQVAAAATAPPAAVASHSPPAVTSDDHPPQRCVVLVPYGLFIHQDCEHGLKQLEERGYTVQRVAGYAAIDQGRSQMATDALLAQFAETMWIDSDVGFHPDDVERLRRHNLPICCGIYPQKGRRALACHVGAGVREIVFGVGGGLREIRYAGAGFLHVRRRVYADISEQLKLPVCNEQFGSPMIPFFQPLVLTENQANWYLAEDYAFCERARQCGHSIMADTSIRLWHVGNYRYGWEDAGIDRERFQTFNYRFCD